MADECDGMPKNGQQMTQDATYRAGVCSERCSNKSGSLCSEVAILGGCTDCIILIGVERI